MQIPEKSNKENILRKIAITQNILDKFYSRVIAPNHATDVNHIKLIMYNNFDLKNISKRI